ncbi:Transcriptional repressor rco-1 [Fusarium oxysporum f. sp. albedinis]|nr:Transcriptional repressor rco-1 [Fusarium oxysporum f. sp. albedinis]
MHGLYIHVDGGIPAPGTLPYPLPSIPKTMMQPLLPPAIQFCHIGNRLLHRCAHSIRISIKEAQTLDREVQDWYNSRPPIIKHTDNTPAKVIIARGYLRNRYYNIIPGRT